MIPAIIAAVGAASGVAGGIMGMFAQRDANAEINRRFRLDAAQQVGSAQANAAAAGADTYGENASPSTTNFLNTMRAEFDRQGKMMLQAQHREMAAKAVGLLAGGAGAAGNIAGSYMASNKVGSTFAPGLGSAPGINFGAAPAFNVASQLQGPNWGR